MNALKRIALFVFGLAGVFCLLSLGLTWVGPYQYEARALLMNYPYYLAVQFCLGVSAVGVLVCLLRALLAPRKRKTVLVSKVGSDEISVTKSAIASQATYAIERSGKYSVEKVRVNAGKQKVSVDVRVRPHNTVNVAAEGAELHEALFTGLRTICGDTLQHTNIEFVDAESIEPAQDVLVEAVDESAEALPEERHGLWSFLSPLNEEPRIEEPSTSEDVESDLPFADPLAQEEDMFGEGDELL